MGNCRNFRCVRSRQSYWTSLWFIGSCCWFRWIRCASGGRSMTLIWILFAFIEVFEWKRAMCGEVFGLSDGGFKRRTEKDAGVDAMHWVKQEKSQIVFVASWAIALLSNFFRIMIRIAFCFPFPIHWTIVFSLQPLTPKQSIRLLVFPSLSSPHFKTTKPLIWFSCS